MHFHLPKPLHGWQELPGEIGVIVIGVLIALSAEQASSHLSPRAFEVVNAPTQGLMAQAQTQASVESSIMGRLPPDAKSLSNHVFVTQREPCMPDRDPDIVTSGLSRAFVADGKRVDVRIYRLEHDRDWMLEVVNDQGTSTVWDVPSTPTQKPSRLSP